MALNLEIALLSSLDSLCKFSPKFSLPVRSLWFADFSTSKWKNYYPVSYVPRAFLVLFFFLTPRYLKLFDARRKGVENMRST